MHIPLLNLDLARQIELAEARAAVDCAEALERSKPSIGAAVKPIGGGFAVYCGAGSPVTQAIGLGLNGLVTDEEFQCLEEFYGSRGEAVRVETCPLAHASLIEQFGKNGYRVTEFSNVMVRPLTGRESLHHAARGPSGVTVERIGPGQMDLWTLTVAQGFSEQTATTQELLETMRAFSAGPNVECYLARVDGAVAGGATLWLREGIAGLFGASTLPAFRNRGVHRALTYVRLARAAAAGCQLASCLAQPGSISQRNVVRQGFSVLYTRVKFERSWS